jgi:hypothetical protein
VVDISQYTHRVFIKSRSLFCRGRGFWPYLHRIHLLAFLKRKKNKTVICTLPGESAQLLLFGGIQDLIRETKHLISMRHRRSTKKLVFLRTAERLFSKIQTYLSDKMHLKKLLQKTRPIWSKFQFSMFFL